VRMLADGCTDTLTDANHFIICLMLHAVAMGQIKSIVSKYYDAESCSVIVSKICSMRIGRVKGF